MKKLPLSLFLILGFAFFLRIYRLKQLFYFMMDEALLAFRGWGIFALKRPFLIGGISPLGFHLPPYFYWFSALFLPFSEFDPITWGILAAVVGVITVFTLFLLARKIGNPRLGLVAAFVYATSFVAIFFDRHYWPLVFNPLMTILTLWLLIGEYKYKWFFLGLLLVFSVSADPSNLTLLILVIYSLLRDKLTLKKTLVFFFTFTILFFIPLILFDLRHERSNIQGINRFLKQVEEIELGQLRLKATLLLPVRTLSMFWYSPQTNISHLHTYCSRFVFARQFKQPIFLQFFALIILVVYYLSKRRFKENGEFYIARLLIIYLLGLLVYGGLLGKPIYDHYLSGLLPVFALITAKVFVRFWPIGFFLILIFSAVNLRQFLEASNPYSLAISRQGVDWVVENLGDEDFALDSISKCFRYNGIRFLFEIRGRPPAISFIDPDFFWLYQEKPAQVFPKKVVLFIDRLSHPDFGPELPIVSQKNFEAWKVLILDNSSRRYKIEF